MPKMKTRGCIAMTTRSPGHRTIVDMIYATHVPKRERKRALRDVYAVEPVAPKFNPWSSCPITFD